MYFSMPFIAATKEFADYDREVPAPYLRGKFALKKLPSSAKLTVTALGFYDVYLNGIRITKGILAPYICNPDQVVVYDEYDILPFLREGENVLGLILGNGFTNNFGGYVWDFDKAPFRAAPKTAFCVEADGKRVFTSADAVKTAPSPIVRDDFREGEVYDARREIAGWNLPGFDDSAWKNAISAPAPSGRRVPADFEPVREYKRRRAVRIFALEDGIVYDFGVNTAGVPVLKIDGRPGQQVELICGEWLRNGKMDTANIRFGGRERAGCDDIQRIVYICKGEKGEGFAPCFSYYGFRYVKVRGIDPAQASEDLVVMSEQSSALERLGDFTCSDALANITFKNTLRSDYANFFYFPTDCPHREKNGWTGDAALSAEQFMLLLGCEKSLRMWLSCIRDGQKENGAISCIVPTSGWGYEWGSGPSWDAVLVRLPYYLYRYRGCRAVLEENADAIAKYLGFLRSIVRADGLIEYGLGDWCQIGTRGGGEHWTPVYVTDTLAGMDICGKAEKIFRVLGQKEREEEAHAFWLQLRASMRKTCGTLPPPRSCRTQTALSMMIAAGVYEENELPDAFRWLADSVCGVQNRLLVGVFGVQSLLRVLCEQGMADTAYEMAMAPDRVSYGAMVAGGATSLWEIPHIDGNGISTGGVASLDHHFWGDIAAWYITYIAGIRVNEQFFDPSRVDISPYFIEKLAYAQASHRTPLGTVRASWQRTGENEIEMFISLPAGAHGTLALHGGWECEGGAALLPGNTVIRAVRRAPLNAMRAEN